MFNMWLGSTKFIENVNFLKIKHTLIYFVKFLPSFCDLDLKNHFLPPPPQMQEELLAGSCAAQLSM